MWRLDCPRCRGPLNRTTLGCLCPECEGCWFGFDQFEKVIHLSDPQLLTSDIEPTLQLDKTDISLEQLILCPCCGQRMKRHLYMFDSDAMVDICREHGMWLDDGELSKIRAYLQSHDSEPQETQLQPAPVGFFRRLFGLRD